MDSFASNLEDTIGDVTDRAGLLDKDNKAAAVQNNGDNEDTTEGKEDKDVILLKKRITDNLLA